MKQSQKILIHVGFWILFTILPQFFYTFLRHPNDISRVYLFIADVGFNIFCFYTAYLLFVPYLLKSSKKWGWIALILLFAFIYFYVSSRVILSFAEDLDIRFFKRFSPSAHHFRELIGTLLFITYARFIRLTENWIVDQRLKSELIKQNKESELALLKSQVSPHFLFNTLNNIYSLVYQQAGTAPSAVMKLSEIMRYMLYEASTDKVMLEKETDYLFSFIELQSLRLHQKNFVEFILKGQTNNKKIAPMLLIPFVENAFKHCDKKVTPPGIVIKLDASGDKIYFEVKNKVSMDKPSTSEVQGGIGLKNVKRRLNLIYPSTHELMIENNETDYIIKLTIFETN